MLIGVDFTALPAGMRATLNQVCSEENALKMLAAKRRQEKIAKFYRDHRPRAMDGIGGMTMSVDPYWLNYFRWLTGETNDDEVRKYMARKWDAFKVRHTGTKLQVGYGSTPERVTSVTATAPAAQKPKIEPVKGRGGRAVKFKKQYAESKRLN